MTHPARRRLPVLIAVAAALGVAVLLARPAAEPVPPPAMPPPTLSPPSSLPPLSPPPPLTPLRSVAPQRGSIAGLSVTATFATRNGGGSILVTRADGTHATIVVGADAAPGIRLTGVAPDRATFVAGATPFWIPLRSDAAAKADPGPAIAAATVAPPPPPAPAGMAELRESQAYQAALAPRQDGAYRGYAVRGAMPLFARAGLRPGDVITGINGRAFDSPAEVAKLAREAAISATVTFQIRRDGRTQELQVQPR